MVTIWNKGCNPNFTIPTGGPKITEILKGTLWTIGTKYYRVLLIHTSMHTHIHTHTNAQNGKNTEFYDTEITVNYVNYVGTAGSTKIT